mmetsp:Transcript_26339/g.84358  ORF Transcript_26339/g.84358 Transcript_26339/m.84358 type:complete len:230 (+) Transcript_26339:1223-1912(+)
MNLATAMECGPTLMCQMAIQVPALGRTMSCSMGPVKPLIAGVEVKVPGAPHAALMKGVQKPITSLQMWKLACGIRGAAASLAAAFSVRLYAARKASVNSFATLNGTGTPTTTVWGFPSEMVPTASSPFLKIMLTPSGQSVSLPSPPQQCISSLSPRWYAVAGPAMRASATSAQTNFILALESANQIGRRKAASLVHLCRGELVRTRSPRRPASDRRVVLVLAGEAEFGS